MDINDLYAAQKMKHSNKMEFFNSILQKCHHRIKTVAQKSETFVFILSRSFLWEYLSIMYISVVNI